MRHPSYRWCAAQSRFCVCIHNVRNANVYCCFMFFNFFCRFSSHLMCFENRLFLIDRERIIHLVGCGRHEKIAHSFYILSLWLLLLLLVISFLPDINVLLTANFTFLLYRFIIKFHECAVFTMIITRHGIFFFNIFRCGCERSEEYHLPRRWVIERKWIYERISIFSMNFSPTNAANAVSARCT